MLHLVIFQQEVGRTPGVWRLPLLENKETLQGPNLKPSSNPYSVLTVVSTTQGFCFKVLHGSSSWPYSSLLTWRTSRPLTLAMSSSTKPLRVLRSSLSVKRGVSDRLAIKDSFSSSLVPKPLLQDANSNIVVFGSRR